MGARMLRKGLAVVVILLFIGLAFAPSINANVSKPDLDTPVEDNTTPMEIEFQRIRELVQTIDLQKLVVNTDAVVNTIEEISIIIEENEDIRNYIDKKSEEDCGCEDDSKLEGDLPVLCTLLYPLVIFSFFLFVLAWAITRDIYFQNLILIMENIGLALNCFWS